MRLEEVHEAILSLETQLDLLKAKNVELLFERLKQPMRDSD